MKFYLSVLMIMFVCNAQTVTVTSVEQTGNSILISGNAPENTVIKVFSQSKKIYEKKHSNDFFIKLKNPSSILELKAFQKNDTIFSYTIPSFDDFEIIILQPIGMLYEPVFSITGTATVELSKVEFFFPHSPKKKFSASVSSKSFFVESVSVDAARINTSSEFFSSGISESEIDFLESQDSFMEDIRFFITAYDTHNRKKTVEHSFLYNKK